MTAITIRNVPEELRDELVARAARSGMTLEQYLLWVLATSTEDSSPDDDAGYEEWLDNVRKQAEEFGNDLTAEEIVAGIHAERR